MLPSALRDTKTDVAQDNVQKEEGNQLIFGLQVLEIMSPNLDKSLLPPAIECLPRLCNLLTHQFKAVRHMASRCIATLATLNTEKVIFLSSIICVSMNVKIINIMRKFFLDDDTRGT